MAGDRELGYRVDLQPAVVGVQHVGPANGDLIACRGNGYIPGEAVAGGHRVGLGDGALADLFQYQVTVLVGAVVRVDQGRALRSRMCRSPSGSQRTSSTVPLTVLQLLMTCSR